ncbi:MAG: hypothetical protein ABIT36_08975 [Steroidobacteraceae bacterium]
MNARAILYSLIAAIGAIIVLTNWSIMSTSVDLSLLLTTVRVPIFMLLVLAAGIVLLVDAAMEATERRRWSLERRQLLADRDQARTELSNVEASRIGALRTDLQGELATIRAGLDRLVEGQSLLLQEFPALRELDAHGNPRLPV